MSQLNPRQRDAVRYIDGPLLVLAGAGSGKTRVITQKIVYLIRECNIAARHIAAVTFTNKAAREMKSRVAEVLGKGESRGLNVSTFHTLGLNIIRREHEALGYKSNFTIYDTQDCQSLLKELMKKSFGEDADVEVVQRHISHWKNAMVIPEEAIYQSLGDEKSLHAAKIYDAYRRQMKTYNAVDFDDLIGLPVQLFKTNAAILDKWQNRIRYLLVDEYQDTNTSQYLLVQLLVGPRGALTVVGDDDQSIYAWRGAQPENLAHLQRDFPPLKVIKLEQNYRSTGCILKAANQLITNNSHVFEKTLWSELGFGEPIKILHARNEDHEAQRVVSQLLHHKFQARNQFSDFAILYRGNHQSRLFERNLREHQIPYRLTGGTSFFTYTEVKDIMAYVRLIVNNDDDHAFLRIVNTPRREIGPTTLETLATYAADRGVSLFEAAYEFGIEQHLPQRSVARLRQFLDWVTRMTHRSEKGEVKSLVRDIVSETDYQTWLQDNCRDVASAERKMENVHELIAWIERLIDANDSESDLSDVVSRLQLMDILDRQENEQERDCVNLMTFHAAKGLEFPYVFMVGVEEDLLPHRASIEDNNIEEERRLAYVGITRAQKQLTLTYAAKRKRAGEWEECQPSRFLSELPEDTVSWEKEVVAVDPQERQKRGQAYLANLRGILSESV
ncbi:DNA helicase Rep [Kaarinaea lacus]